MGEGPEDKLKGLAEGEWFGDGSEDSGYLAGDATRSRADRREGERRRVHLEVRVEPGGRPGTVGDISVGGMLVYSDTVISPGCPVELTLMGERGTARARGIVRWASRSIWRDGSDERIGMGIRFTWVSLGLKALVVHAREKGEGFDLPGL